MRIHQFWWRRMITYIFTRCLQNTLWAAKNYETDSSYTCWNGFTFYLTFTGSQAHSLRICQSELTSTQWIVPRRHLFEPSDDIFEPLRHFRCFNAGRSTVYQVAPFGAERRLGRKAGHLSSGRVSTVTLTYCGTAVASFGWCKSPVAKWLWMMSTRPIASIRWNSQQR